jgi:hypothetical protein
LMYRLQYGRVVLDVTTVNSWEERVETTEDGVDTLWTKIEGHVSSVWSPWTQGTVPDFGINAAMTAAEKKAALRAALSQARQRLIFSIPDHSGGDPDGANVLLLSPLNRPVTPANPQAGLAAVPANTPYPCDANNGPVVQVQAIREMQGEVTMIVDLKFTTWINESNTVHRMISNRWTQIEELDDKFWSRKITTGKAYFRADALRVPAPGGGYTLLSADQFRESALPPVPNGFQRRATRVENQSDGVSIIYQVVDEQCALMPVNRKIARIRGYYQDSYMPGNIAGIKTAIESGFEIGALLIESGPVGIGAGLAVTAAGLVGALPHKTITVYLHVDGRPDATQTDLVGALSRAASGLNVGGSSLGQVLATALLFTDSLTQSLDDDGIWAEMLIQFSAPVVASAALGLLGLAPATSRQALFTNPANGNALPPDQTGIGQFDSTKPNAGMVAVVPNQAGSPRGAAGSGTPPSDTDPTRGVWNTEFLRAPDLKGSEDPAKQITNTNAARTNTPPGDVKQLGAS